MPSTMGYTWNTLRAVLSGKLQSFQSFIINSMTANIYWMFFISLPWVCKKNSRTKRTTRQSRQTSPSSWNFLAPVGQGWKHSTEPGNNSSREIKHTRHHKEVQSPIPYRVTVRTLLQFLKKTILHWKSKHREHKIFSVFGNLLIRKLGFTPDILVQAIY